MWEGPQHYLSCEEECGKARPNPPLTATAQYVGSVLGSAPRSLSPSHCIGFLGYPSRTPRMPRIQAGTALPTCPQAF